MNTFNNNLGKVNPIFEIMCQQNNMMSGPMTEQEIQKHKNRLNQLISKLINTHNIEEEISINNEIKKETDILQSLLNIKYQQNILQPMNQMIQQQIMQQQMQLQMIQQQVQQQMMQQQMMKQQQVMNTSLDYENCLDLYFEDQNIKITVWVRINEQKRVKEAISLYILKSGKTSKCKFVFNNHTLNPEMKICQTGLSQNSKILVIQYENIMGG